MAGRYVEQYFGQDQYGNDLYGEEWVEDYVPSDSNWDTPIPPYTGDSRWDTPVGDYSNLSDFYGDQETKLLADAVSTAAGDSVDIKKFLSDVGGYMGSAGKDFIKQYLYDSSTGKVNLAGIATAAAALYNNFGGGGTGSQAKSTAYQGKIPEYQAVRQQVDFNDPNRRPGSTGRQYLTQTQFVAPENVGAATDTANRQAGIIAANTPVSAKQVNPYEGKFRTPYENIGNVSTVSVPASSSSVDSQGLKSLTNPLTNPYTSSSNMPLKMPTLSANSYTPYAKPSSNSDSATMVKLPSPEQQAQQDAEYAKFKQAEAQFRSSGGQGLYLSPELMNPQASATSVPMASGGIAQPRYLQGQTDGMADKIPSSIDGKQKAALSHGEFVIPADVVSHLGNGNSDAGAKKLYEMMSRVRKARTGNPKQGKRINPNKFMPGGQVNYAEGGIAKFSGESGSAVVGTGVTSPTVSGLGTSVAENLSSWAGPYVSNYLGQGAALAQSPYQTYKGPLTAGASDLQQQQFAGLSGLTQTGYTPASFKSGIFDTGAAQSYMNPYISSALDPQLQELSRQGKIQNLANQAQATKMGAFGSSGSALMQTEGQRNTLDKMQEALGQGYSTAYDKAMAQFNSDQQRQMDAQKANEASRQYSSDFGVKSLSNLGAAGETQRSIEQAGIEADKKQFEEQRDYPYKMVQYQKDLLTGLPITTKDSSDMQNQISSLSNQVTGLMSLYKTLSSLGQKP
jgi:hypothetical protein